MLIHYSTQAVDASGLGAAPVIAVVWQGRAIRGEGPRPISRRVSWVMPRVRKSWPPNSRPGFQRAAPTRQRISPGRRNGPRQCGMSGAKRGGRAYESMQPTVPASRVSAHLVDEPWNSVTALSYKSGVVVTGMRIARDFLVTRWRSVVPCTVSLQRTPCVGC